MLRHTNIKTGTATVNGDLIFQMLQWISYMRGKEQSMMALGAPYEADAQLVQLEKQGLVDAILSEDGDLLFLNAKKIQFGYNTCETGGQQFFDSVFPDITHKVTKDFTTVDINSWFNSPRSKAATAAFLGTDYNRSSSKITLCNGMVERVVKAFVKCDTIEMQNQYLRDVGRASKCVGQRSQVSMMTSVFTSNNRLCTIQTETDRGIRFQFSQIIRNVFALSRACNQNRKPAEHVRRKIHCGNIPTQPLRRGRQIVGHSPRWRF